MVGQGNIGAHVTRKLEASVDVLTFDVLHDPMDELKSLSEQADVITLHVPLIEATIGFIDAEKLSWMKGGAALVNTARGPVLPTVVRVAPSAPPQPADFYGADPYGVSERRLLGKGQNCERVERY